MSDISKETRNMYLNILRFEKQVEAYKSAIESGDLTITEQKEMNKHIFNQRSDSKFSYKEWKDMEN